MWPFDVLSARAHARRRQAALIVLLGVCRYERLTAQEKFKIEEQIAEMLHWTGVPFVAHRRNATWSAKATYRAVAMFKLGIETGIESLPWAALLPRSWVLNPALAWLSFRQRGPSVAEAKACLLGAGYSSAELVTIRTLG